MTHPRPLLVTAALVVPLLLAGCSGSKPLSTPPPRVQAAAPILTPDVRGTANKRVGDAAEVIWSSDQPVRWELTSSPLGWDLELLSDTQAKVGGTYQMGASQRTEVCEVRATSLAGDLQSTGTTEHRARVRVVDPASFAHIRDEGVTKQYRLDLRSEMPPWSDAGRGKVHIDADTRGLSNPGGGWTADKIEVYDDDDRKISTWKAAFGPCTKEGTVEPEERFSVSGAPWMAAFADGVVHIVLSNHAAPPQGRCEEVDALLRVKVIFE